MKCQQQTEEWNRINHTVTRQGVSTRESQYGDAGISWRDWLEAERGRGTAGFSMGTLLSVLCDPVRDSVTSRKDLALQK